MMFDRNYLYTKCADKFLVREYVKNRIGDEYLVPLVACLDQGEDLKKLSNLKNCVVKPNHGAGFVEFIGNDDLSNDDLDKLAKKANKWLKLKFGAHNGQWHYVNIPPKIIVEKSICIDGQAPDDFKFHMFKQKDGSFQYVLQVMTGRFSNEKTNAFYVNNLANCVKGDDALDAKTKFMLSKCLPLSEALMDNFNYARIDWYIQGEKIYFGEITFTPGAGKSMSAGAKLQKLMGQMWQL